MKIRRATFNDLEKIFQLEEETWGLEKAASKEMLKSRITIFSEGNFIAEENGLIIGYVSITRINYDLNQKERSWNEITDNGFIEGTFDPNGNAIFGVNLSVSPQYQCKGVGSKLLEYVARVAINLNVQYGLLGGRLPEYYKYAEKLTPEEYLNAKDEKTGKELDPEVYFYKKVGFKIVKIIPNYFKDPESLNFGVLLLWKNPLYNKWSRKIFARFFSI